uniref:Akirin n=1 Tax=Caenorhabditis japonica TaxID=281687 RepID=A0A8R1DL04_CAEJA
MSAPIVGENMACGLALKRPLQHEYESFLADESYNGEAKRARTQCPPFRAQMGTIAATLPSTSTTFAQKFKEQEESIFQAASNLTRLSKNQLKTYLVSEVKNLRKRKALPRSNDVDEDGDQRGDGCSSSYSKQYRAPCSPKSGSDSEGETPSTSVSERMNTKREFTMANVQVICERLLKEQEIRLRNEFEMILAKKLDEQHQQYVQFAAEQYGQKCVTAGDDYSYSYLS